MITCLEVMNNPDSSFLCVQETEMHVSIYLCVCVCVCVCVYVCGVYGVCDNSCIEALCYGI